MILARMGKKVCKHSSSLPTISWHKKKIIASFLFQVLGLQFSIYLELQGLFFSQTNLIQIFVIVFDCCDVELFQIIQAEAKAVKYVASLTCLQKLCYLLLKKLRYLYHVSGYFCR